MRDEPKQEKICDNLDNDCDGSVDETLERPCGTTDVGICRLGVETCTNGAWSSCNNAIEPKTEICDTMGLDEDCDGSANEDCDCSDSEPRISLGCSDKRCSFSLSSRF